MYTFTKRRIKISSSRLLLKRKAVEKPKLKRKEFSGFGVSTQALGLRKFSYLIRGPSF